MQITEHIHALKIPFQIRDNTGGILERFVYVYLIYGSKNVCLIDTGVVLSDKIIFDYLEKSGKRYKDISMIILSHSHPDHIGAVAAIKTACNCVVAANKWEQHWIENVDLQAKERPVPNFHSLVGGAVTVDCILEDGEILDFDEVLKIEVFHTPGHSKGSISLLLLEDRAIFTGDLLLRPLDMPIYEDVISLVHSIKRLRSIEDIKVLFSSWAEPKKGEDIYKMIDDSLTYLQRIHQQVLAVADESPSFDSMQLCTAVLKRLNLPLTMANPLVAKSFQANLMAKNYNNLLEV